MIGIRLCDLPDHVPEYFVEEIFSTSSVCMIAIWPVGSPKEIKPSFSQNRNASATLGGCVATLARVSICDASRFSVR